MTMQKLFSRRVYATCCWLLLLTSVLLAMISNVVAIDEVELSLGRIDVPMKFINPQMVLRVAAVLVWVLIIVVGRGCGMYAKKDILPIGLNVLALVIMAWRYEDIVSATSYQDVNMWWFVLLMVLGSIIGVAISVFIDGWRCRRTNTEMKNTGLPKNPIVSIAFFRMAMFIGVVALLACVLFPLFYRGRFCLPIIWLLSFVILFIPTSQESAMGFLFKRLKDYSDWVEYGRVVNLLAPLFVKYNKDELLHSVPQQIQKEAADQVKGLYAKLMPNCQILSYEHINQCCEEMVRIVWCTDSLSVNESYLTTKQAYKYWHAYQWLCKNDKEYKESGATITKETCLLYALQDYLLAKKKYSLLEWRVYVQDSADLEVIIKASNSINEALSSGWTLLLHAVANDFIVGIRLLLKYGADTEKGNVNGVTPVLYAVRYDNVPCLTILIGAGASVRVKDKRGYTPLMVAAEHNSKSVVPMLLKEGANLKSRNYFGKTALDIAVASHAGDIASMIRVKMKEMGVKRKRKSSRRKR